MRAYIFALMATTCAALAIPCKAQKHTKLHFPEPSADVVLLSAQACYVEATWSLDDCAALLHVIRKRSSKLGFVEMLKRYSVANWTSKTVKEIKSASFVSNPDKPKPWNDSWFSLLEHVRNIFSGKISDPCPRAKHWAAPTFEPRSPMTRVFCSVNTKNFFWAEL